MNEGIVDRDLNGGMESRDLNGDINGGMKLNLGIVFKTYLLLFFK